MSKSLAALVLALVIPIVVSVGAQSSKRVITHEDVWLLHRVGDPC